MFILTRVGQERRDCTATYDVILDREYTVGEFIFTVLSSIDEWGCIMIGDDPSETPIETYLSGKKRYEYRHGKILSDVPEDLLNKKVDCAKADGGWTRMDYFIFLQREEKKDA